MNLISKLSLKHKNVKQKISKNDFGINKINDLNFEWSYFNHDDKIIFNYDESIIIEFHFQGFFIDKKTK